ncbi:MAG: DoxX family protein [Planctomycetes bacterium]|nr:DoxX family protein [Planctomycetota bacterium]
MLPALHPPEASYRISIGLLAVRLVIGVAFMLHGWGKIQQPMSWMGPDATIPGILQACAAVAEFGGGALWILGLLTPLASLGILVTMAVAMLTHIKRGDPFVGHGVSYEPAFAYLSVALLLLFAGPGRFSLDALQAKRR